jgi:hypothetical protein
MSTTSKSFAVSIGRGIGYSAAAVAHGAAVSVKATGQFGADVVAGTTEGYIEHSERFAAIRAQVAGQRTKSIAINVKRQAKATA